MRALLIFSAVLVLSACHKPQQPAQNQASPAAEAGPHKGVDRSHKGQAFPAVRFGDKSGAQIGRERFRGRPTLVNFWATWCGPCVKELPTLARLSEARKADLEVVPISEDDGPRVSVDAFVEHLGLKGFDVYYDPKMAVSDAVSADVFPTTILYDANGKEVWRYVGDLDWTGLEAAKLLAEAGAASKRG